MAAARRRAGGSAGGRICAAVGPGRADGTVLRVRVAAAAHQGRLHHDEPRVAVGDVHDAGGGLAVVPHILPHGLAHALVQVVGVDARDARHLWEWMGVGAGKMHRCVRLRVAKYVHSRSTCRQAGAGSREPLFVCAHEVSRGGGGVGVDAARAARTSKAYRSERRPDAASPSSTRKPCGDDGDGSRGAARCQGVLPWLRRALLLFGRAHGPHTLGGRAPPPPP